MRGNAFFFLWIRECFVKTCKKYTRAYLNFIINKEEVAGHLITTHNLYYLLNLMRNFRQAVLEERLESFIK